MSAWLEAKAETEADFRVRDEDMPKLVGYWMVRRGPGFPEVPAMVAGPLPHEPGEPDNLLDRSPLCMQHIYYAELAGEPCNPYAVAWCREMKPISRQEYNFQLARLAYNRKWRGLDIKHNKRVDVTKLPAIGPED